MTKKILVIEKRTSFEFIKNILDKNSQRYYKLQTSHLEHNQVKNEVLRKISELSFKYDLFKDNQVHKINYDKYENILILGGDGTFLHGVKFTTNQVVMGINTDLKKSFGKLMRHNINNYEKPLKKFLKGKVKCEKWNKLCVSVNGEKLPYLALNEVYIGNDSIKKTSHLFVEIENESARVLGNGILISTKKGSTAMYRSVTKSSFDVDGIGYSIILPFKIKGNLKENQILNLKSKIKIIPKRQGYSVSFDCDPKRDVKIEQEDEIVVEIDKTQCLRVVI